MKNNPIFLKINNKSISLPCKGQPNSEPPYWDWCLIEEDLISVNIKNKGHWEDHLTLIYQNLIKSGDVVIDAGANIGGHTMNFAYSVGEQGKVIAFEPQSFIFNILTTNILLNNFSSRVNQYKLALSNTIKRGKMEATEYREKLIKTEKGMYGWHLDGSPISVNYGGSGISNLNSLKNKGENINIVTIDSLNLPKLNLIKIDIQGSELEALEGGVKTLNKFKPTIFIENYAHNGLSKDIQVVNLLKSWGYIGYRLLILNQDDCIFFSENNHQKVLNILNKYFSKKQILKL